MATIALIFEKHEMMSKNRREPEVRPQEMETKTQTSSSSFTPSAAQKRVMDLLHPPKTAPKMPPVTPHLVALLGSDGSGKRTAIAHVYQTLRPLGREFVMIGCASQLAYGDAAPPYFGTDLKVQPRHISSLVAPDMATACKILQHDRGWKPPTLASFKSSWSKTESGSHAFRMLSGAHVVVLLDVGHGACEKDTAALDTLGHFLQALYARKERPWIIVCDNTTISQTLRDKTWMQRALQDMHVTTINDFGADRLGRELHAPDSVPNAWKRLEAAAVPFDSKHVTGKFLFVCATSKTASTTNAWLRKFMTKTSQTATWFVGMRVQASSSIPYADASDGLNGGNAVLKTVPVGRLGTVVHVTSGSKSATAPATAVETKRVAKATIEFDCGIVVCRALTEWAASVRMDSFALDIQSLAGCRLATDVRVLMLSDQLAEFDLSAKASVLCLVPSLTQLGAFHPP